MAPTACLAEPAAPSGLEVALAAQAPLTAQPSSAALDANQMLAFMETLGIADRASTLPDLEKGYEAALATATGLDDVSVKIFSTPEQAEEYEITHSTDGKTRVGIVSLANGELYSCVVMESSDPMAQERMNSSNKLFEMLTDRVASKIGDKMKYWKDGRSGLHTDAYVEECGIERRIAGQTAKEKGFGIIYMDLDNFKRYNDIDSSHQTGDNVIRMAGDAIRKSTRSNDIPVREGQSADEFMVYVFGCSPDELTAVAERIRNALGQYEIPGHQDLKITASIGVAHSYEATGKVGTSARVSTIKALADKRMYQAKSDGRDRVIGPSQIIHTSLTPAEGGYLPPDGYLAAAALPMPGAEAGKNVA